MEIQLTSNSHTKSLLDEHAWYHMYYIGPRRDKIILLDRTKAILLTVRVGWEMRL